MGEKGQGVDLRGFGQEWILGIKRAGEGRWRRKKQQSIGVVTQQSSGVMMLWWWCCSVVED